MNPYRFVEDATANGESLLSLCCGIGLELRYVTTPDVTAVDIAPQYLEKVHELCPHAKLVCSDALDYLMERNDNSVDVVSIIDGIEHLPKREGYRLLKHAKRVARRQVLVFTPEGYLKNEPHNAWGIEGADHLQQHQSGWLIKDFEKRGFVLVDQKPGISQHDEPYRALMLIYTKGQPLV